MKRLIISNILLLSFLLCLGQWDSRARIEISAGGSYPYGEFSYAKFDYAKSGFAENGIALAVSFNYRMNGHLGLLASVSEYLLGVEEASVAKKYWIYGFGWNFQVESQCWNLTACMGGIDIILPVYKSDFNFRLLGGFSRTRLPGLTGNEHNFKREARTDIAAAWSAGGGLTYQYFDRITLSIRADFFMTHPILEDIWSSDIGSGSVKTAHKISILNLSAGVGFRIF